MNHNIFMNRAYQEAMRAFDEGEVPVGAVIEKDGNIIGRGYNRVESLSDATAHAEIIAISAASSKLSTWRLSDCTIYVTAEPCLMCLGALVLSRIKTIVYGTGEPRTGAIQSHYYRQQIERSFGYFPEVISGIMEYECAQMMSSFFKQVRADKNNSSRKN
ncbi:MAG: nucleoside deaminase [Fibrobacter sp.]|nr:nucleoside deaminase [Fibrobacter sp.]